MRTALAALATIATLSGAAHGATPVRTETILIPVVEEDRPEVEIGYDPETLPDAVQRTRRMIIEAASTGDVERMLPVVEMNEMPPNFSFGDVEDPVELWRRASGDENGREILAIMIELLEAGYAHVDPGGPQEMFVWPYFHEMAFEDLTPRQEVELYKIITPQDREQMEIYGSYTFYRLGIGPDGTWHYFVAGD